MKRPWLVLACLVLVAAVAGGSLGYFMRLDLPDVRILENYNPPLMTRVYAHDGAMVDTFAEQRRIMVDYQDIPRSFLEGLIATEDAGFYNHTGVGMRGMFRAAFSDLRQMRLEEGFSTITMQLVRSLTNRRQKTIQRKLEEMLLAIEVERDYTKEEILQFYCNQVYMGHGRYGLEAAARHYFGKTAPDLTPAESALLVGVIQRPESLTPYRHPERALRRRAHVLNRMVQVGFLDQDTAHRIGDEPLVLATGRTREKPARYFIEEVRRWLKSRYGDTSVYKEGLEVRTTLDLELQALADRAMDHGLRELDKRQGWRGAAGRIPEGEDPAIWSPPSWADGILEGEVLDGVVTAVDAKRAEVRIGDYAGLLEEAQIAWTRNKNPSKILSVGDLVRVRVMETKDDGTAELSLEQEPEVEAALVALNPASGEVLALFGGFDFDRSEWNRATQALRQTGSAFKPFVFAAALANGWTLADTHAGRADRVSGPPDRGAVPAGELLQRLLRDPDHPHRPGEIGQYRHRQASGPDRLQQRHRHCQAVGDLRRPAPIPLPRPWSFRDQPPGTDQRLRNLRQRRGPCGASPGGGCAGPFGSCPDPGGACCPGCGHSPDRVPDEPLS